MANSIYKSDNYLIVERDGKVYEYALIKTVYTRNDEGGVDKFEIIESNVSGGGGGRSTILVADVDANLWLDSPTGVPYTAITLTTFLRQNTANFSKGGATTFEQLTDVPSYLNNALKWLRINALENGIEAVENIETYKTIWKTIPIFNGSFGLANTGNALYRPKIKIINRTIYFSGFLVLPQTTTAGGSTLDTNAALYTLQSKNWSDLYLSATDGYTIDNKNQCITANPILPTALRPQENLRNFEKTVMSKTKNITGGRMRLNAWLDGSFILTDGRLFLRSMEAQERNGDTGTGWNQNNLSRQVVSKFNLGDKLMNFDNYRNALDAGGLDTLRTPNVEGFTFDYSIDGNRSQDFGGFIPEFSFSYPLSDAYTIDQIKTAFDAL